jgi:phosphoglycerate dehydrogenase-like enzyme
MGGFDLAEIVAADPLVGAEEMADAGARKVELPELLRASDFISVHVPHVPATHHLLGSAEFAMMKPNAIVVKARAPLD